MFFKKTKNDIKALRDEFKEIRGELKEIRGVLEKIREDASAAHSYAKCSARSIEAGSLATANAHYRIEEAVKALNTVIEGEQKALQDAPTIDAIVDEMWNGVNPNE